MIGLLLLLVFPVGLFASLRLRLSEGPVEDDRVEVLKDMVMKECLATVVKPKLIQTAAFAYREVGKQTEETA